MNLCPSNWTAQTSNVNQVFAYQSDISHLYVKPIYTDSSILSSYSFQLELDQILRVFPGVARKLYDAFLKLSGIIVLLSWLKLTRFFALVHSGHVGRLADDPMFGFSVVKKAM